jgi:hypothetical protein
MFQTRAVQVLVSNDMADTFWPKISTMVDTNIFMHNLATVMKWLQ